MNKLLSSLLGFVIANGVFASQNVSVYTNVPAMITVTSSNQFNGQQKLRHTSAPLLDLEFTGRTWIKVAALVPGTSPRDKGYSVREFVIHPLEQNYNSVFMVEFCPSLFHGPPRVSKRRKFIGFRDKSAMCCNCCYGVACTSKSKCKRNLRWQMERPQVREIRGFRFGYRGLRIERDSTYRKPLSY